MSELIFGSIALSFVGLILMALALFFFFRTRSFISSSQQVKGTVTQMIYIDDSDGGGYSPVFRFRTLDGRDVEVTEKLISNPPQFKVGQIIDVLYDPENPSRARVKKGFNLYFVPILLGFLGLLFGCVGVILIGSEVLKFFK
jgi:hypothetical protein